MGERGTPVAAFAPAAVCETHSGIVFFVGDRAYKLKKPVNLGFLDFTTREARLADCRREVELNRRLAPDVYLGIADVSAPDGRLCDHLVVMRRMPADRRLSTLASRGQVDRDQIRRLVGVLARFHASADRSRRIDGAATRDANAERWQANADEMAIFRGRLLMEDVFDGVVDLADRFLAGRDPLFERRIADGRICDGHGDLLADDIFLLADGPRVLDCLEFDERLRFGDCLADLAFLAMDLEWLGRPDLASNLLDDYEVMTGDRWPPALAHHYVAYRAQVRAKVAAIRWSQGDEASAMTATGLLALSRRHLQHAQVGLVLVGGLPGTGKSTVAHGLGNVMGATVLRSDEVRKELAGMDPGERAPADLDQGLYAPAAAEATYRELLSRARLELGLGQTVVLDATWREPRWRRAAAALASEARAGLSELRCVAPLQVAVDRIHRRASAGTDPSDVTEDVARSLAAGEAPWPTATVIDTTGTPDAAICAALAVCSPL